MLHSAFDFYNDLVDCSVIEDLCGSTSGIREQEAALIVLRSCITEEARRHGRSGGKRDTGRRRSGRAFSRVSRARQEDRR